MVELVKTDNRRDNTDWYSKQQLSVPVGSGSAASFFTAGWLRSKFCDSVNFFLLSSASVTAAGNKKKCKMRLFCSVF